MRKNNELTYYNYDAVKYIHLFFVALNCWQKGFSIENIVHVAFTFKTKQSRKKNSL